MIHNSKRLILSVSLAIAVFLPTPYTFAQERNDDNNSQQTQSDEDGDESSNGEDNGAYEESQSEGQVSEGNEGESAVKHNGQVTEEIYDNKTGKPEKYQKDPTYYEDQQDSPGASTEAQPVQSEESVSDEEPLEEGANNGATGQDQIDQGEQSAQPAPGELTEEQRQRIREGIQKAVGTVKQIIEGVKERKRLKEGGGTYDDSEPVSEDEYVESGEPIDQGQQTDTQEEAPAQQSGAPEGATDNLLIKKEIDSKTLRIKPRENGNRTINSTTPSKYSRSNTRYIRPSSGTSRSTGSTSSNRCPTRTSRSDADTTSTGSRTNNSSSRYRRPTSSTSRSTTTKRDSRYSRYRKPVSSTNRSSSSRVKGDDDNKSSTDSNSKSSTSR